MMMTTLELMIVINMKFIRLINKTLCLLFLLFIFASPIYANISATEPIIGDFPGLSLPVTEDNVDVISEDLTFKINSSFFTADVTADYTLQNNSSKDLKIPAAFIFLTVPVSEIDSVNITVDGKEVQAQLKWFHEMLWHEVDKWIKDHKELTPIAQEVLRLKKSTADEDREEYKKLIKDLHASVTNEGVNLEQHSSIFFSYFLEKLAAGEAGEPGNAYNALSLLESMIPKKVEKAKLALTGNNTDNSWIDPETGEKYKSNTGYRLLAFYSFEIELPKNSTKNVVVNYLQTSSLDEEKEIIHFEYLLQPAANWNSFKNLNLEVMLLEDMAFASNLDLEKTIENGNVFYRNTFSELPQENLTLSMLPPKGTVDGAEQSNSYIIIPIIIFLVFIIICIAVLFLIIRFIYKKIKK